jgi:osmotically-inducible protein OsmY
MSEKTSLNEKHFPFHETVHTAGVDYDSPWKQGSVDPEAVPAHTTQAGKGPRGYVRRDERIYEDLCEALTVNDELDASGVEVSVATGRVTLNGTVASQWAKHEVEKVARACPGVREIDNRLSLQRAD